MVNGPVRLIALALAILGSLLLALVHLPRPAAMLRRPGVAPLAGGPSAWGGVRVALGPAGAGQEDDDEHGIIAHRRSGLRMALTGDLLESFLHQSTGGFVPATAAVMALGGGLIAACLCCGRLSALSGKIQDTSRGSRKGGAQRPVSTDTMPVPMLTTRKAANMGQAAGAVATSSIATFA